MNGISMWCEIMTDTLAYKNTNILPNWRQVSPEFLRIQRLLAAAMSRSAKPGYENLIYEKR